MDMTVKRLGTLLPLFHEIVCLKLELEECSDDVRRGRLLMQIKQNTQEKEAILDWIYSIDFGSPVRFFVICRGIWGMSWRQVALEYGHNIRPQNIRSMVCRYVRAHGKNHRNEAQEP